jgi:hypothetical protein
MKLLLAAMLACFSTAAQQKPALTWRQTLEERLPYLGHRNWIVIADSAYPLQSGQGIETILSNESQVETVRHVLTTLAKVPHVRPVVYVDKELSFVSEQDAVGISAYRQLLTGLFESKLPGQKINNLLHEQVIHQLDEAGKTFNVLIIKTNMTLPYTSVFLQLSAAYWSDEAEQRMRQSIR